MQSRSPTPADLLERPEMTASAMNSAGISRSNARWRRRGSQLQDAFLVVITALFVYVYGKDVLTGHKITSLFFAIEQSILVFMFLTRRRSQATSTRPIDWLAATIGGWLPLALRPHDGGADTSALVGTGLQMAGLTLTTIGFLALGKSFGVVAANRGLKVKGPYSIVRHPIYFSHTVTMSGFVVANFTPLNLIILVAVSVFQIVRIHGEERVLTATGDYAEYRSRVRYRLVPGVY
jgi:protein-S-isoprenylcysteine O-methyltransferase Ste14